MQEMVEAKTYKPMMNKRGAKGSKPRKKNWRWQSQLTHGPGEKSVLLTVPRICLFYFVFFDFCHCSRLQISGLVFKSSVQFGRIFLSDGFKMPLLLWGWQICWRGKKRPWVSEQRTQPIGLGFGDGLALCSRVDHRIHWSAPKWTFESHLLKKYETFGDFCSGVRDLLILKKRGKSILKPFTIWLEITPFSHEKCEQVLVIYSSQAAGCIFASYIPETSFCTLQGSLFKQEFCFLQPLCNSTISFYNLPSLG